jgi:uncharacterized protein (TIGR03905 family)
MFEYTPRGTCSRKICFDITDGHVHNVSFTAGCNGNLKALGLLVEGMTPAALIAKLKGINCDHRGTSCADQLAQAVAGAVGQSSAP